MQHTKNGIYVFVDPFNRTDSGVTTYTLLASEQIASLGIETKIIQISQDEDLEYFCTRVKTEINEIDNLLCLEAPESLASTRLVDSNVPIHIRLHCSRSLGAAVQAMPFDKKQVALEQREISRATFLSSPSWASYFASQSLFNFKAIPAFFPNPAPSGYTYKNKQNEFDVVFVGRFQKLKGTQYLEEIALALKKLKFAIVCPPTETHLSNLDNITFIDGTKISKSEIYSLSNLVMIPSIFETSSMVAIEALTHGCRVILWEHLGVVEYFDSLAELVTVPSEDIKRFINAIEATHKLSRSRKNQEITKSINDAFRSGTTNLLERGSDTALISRPKKHIEQYLKDLVNSQIKVMTKKKQTSFIKKTKKLVLHPIAFFRDSKEAKYIRNKITERKLKKLMLLREEFKNHPAFAVKTQPVIARSTPVAAILDTSTPQAQEIILNNYFTSITEEGRIEFKVRPAKPQGYATAFLHGDDADQELLISTLQKLNTFDDFKYVNTERMQLGSFKIPDHLSALSIINRIDVKSKNNLSEINFLILLNAPSNLCNALRYSGTEQKIILIKTYEHLDVDPESVDGVISLFEEKDADQLRRLINVDSANDIPTAIRRILQEGFPRKKDMLLPITFTEISDFKRADFVNFDSRHHQGILKIKPVDYSKAHTMTDVYDSMADSVVGIAVLESIYMRYRSQCERVEQGESATNLIKACLKDGVLFDVQEV
ncbi:glycosyltransferase [Pseudomonas kielensis]|uniref:glycosyltransferase n=1 Tax=Pseudomonas kielensis TaxID=2762577 RepID=UPI00223F6534|nr:glycosyltransferase [Pseudomonas kielensis]UZM16113.1 glycosyltransferase [Pseudomonas kielensis]